MSKDFRLGISLLLTLFFFSGNAWATQPGNEVNPNGFPSGEHYNLNIHGKNADFSCPQQQYDELTGAPIYGNSVFIPETGQDIQLLMQSGSTKGQKAAAITSFQAIDPCTAAFDGSPAVIQLPPNDKGYKVYARALASPTDQPFMEIMPNLVMVQDEFGNDLMYLGLVTSNGFDTPYQTLTRQKGQSKALDITGMFNWSGSVCYLTQDYCLGTECAATILCCTDADSDGVFENCAPMLDSCPAGTVQTQAYCRDYTSEWVFNIGDFVQYLWEISNTGSKLVQVRFYPQS